MSEQRMKDKCDCRCHGSVEANKSYGGWYCKNCRYSHETSSPILAGQPFRTPAVPPPAAEGKETDYRLIDEP